MSPAPPATRRRSTRTHQCADCRQYWALRLVDHPAGLVLQCRHCGAVRRLVVQHTRRSLSGD